MIATRCFDPCAANTAVAIAHPPCFVCPEPAALSAPAAEPAKEPDTKQSSTSA